ncbi:MAG TPA: aldose epimerase family protein [Terriglobia bacterium]|nr:aldose epimerase family protein [Terriglobia bacterium]
MIGRKLFHAFAVLLVLTAAVVSAGARKPKAGVIRDHFGKTPDGVDVDVFTLTNDQGMEVRAMTFGAVILSIRVPDRDGKFDDVALGFDTLEPYFQNAPHFGSVVGRYANRIAKGQFTLDGAAYRLALNNGPNHLHGGARGFDKVVWKADEFSGQSMVGVRFRYTSPDGEEGYPGKLDVEVSYTLTPRNELIVDYSAKTDKATPVNLSQHTYFNLAGEGGGDVLGHVLSIAASRFTPVDRTLIPTGALASVEGTPFDFRTPTPIGARIDADHEQIRLARGYDHNFALDKADHALASVARVVEPKSGRVLEVRTTEPGLQLYTANGLNASGKNGHVYRTRSAFCLETQHFPDSPNHPDFPSTILRPGETFSSRTEFAFSTVDPR